MAITAAPLPPHVVTIEAHSIGQLTELRVVGKSPSETKVRFELNVVGNSKSTHKGAALLRSGEQQILSRIRFTTSPNWCATLNVMPDGAKPYQILSGDCHSNGRITPKS
jgi:hypothetical protein